MTKPPKNPLTDAESTLQQPRGSRTGGSKASSTKALRDSLKSFASQVRANHGLLDRKEARQLCRRLEYLITPRPRKGRPRVERITQATEMFECQRRKNNGCRVNWNHIAQVCIPGYGGIRSMYRRRVELSKLRNAVYARLGRRDAHESKPIARPNKSKRPLFVSAPRTVNGHGARAEKRSDLRDTNLSENEK